jgi:hypothetical protein
MTVSLQKQLKCREVTLEVALQTLVHETNLTISLLDEQLCMSFFRQLRDRVTSLPVIPLLLWQNCYYLGSPIAVSSEDLNQLCYRLHTNVTIIPISAQSYREWFRQQNLINNQLNASEIINPLTEAPEIEDVSEATELN